MNIFNKTPSKIARYLNAFREYAAQLGPEDQMKDFTITDVSTGAPRNPNGMYDSVVLAFNGVEGVQSVVRFVPYFETVNGELLSVAVRMIGFNDDDERALRAALNTPEGVKLLQLPPVVEPTAPCGPDLTYLPDLLPVLMQRVMLEALTYHAFDKEKGKAAKEVSLVGKLANAMLTLNWRSGKGGTRDLFGHPVRDDHILTLVVQDRAPSDQAHPNNRHPVAVLEVTGYVDFKLSPDSLVGNMPWSEQMDKFIPEFIVTGIQVPKEDGGPWQTCGQQLFPNVEAIFMALTLVNSYMHTGVWMQHYVEHIGSESFFDLMPLAPKRLDERHPIETVSAVLRDILDCGHMVSVDVNYNPAGDYSLMSLLEATQGPNAADDMLRFYEHALSVDMQRLSTFPQSLFVGTSVGIPLGIYKNHRQFTGKPMPTDVRHIDYLALRNMFREERDVADEFAATQFYQPMHHRGMSMFSSGGDANLPKRSEFLTGHTDAVITGRAERITIHPQFLHVLGEMTGMSGVYVRFDNEDHHRPTVRKDAVVR